MWEPWSQNLYTYVGNNPVNYVDPTGHCRAEEGASGDCPSSGPGDVSSEKWTEFMTCEALRYFQGSYTEPTVGCVLKFPQVYGDDAEAAIYYEVVMGAVDTLLRGGMVAYSLSGTMKLSGSNINHLNGAISEARGYLHATRDLKHQGIQAPGRVTAPGPDYITYDPKSKTVVVWDAKYSSTGKYPSTVNNFGSQAWLDATKAAINNVSDQTLRNDALSAFNSGRIQWQIFKGP